MAFENKNTAHAVNGSTGGKGKQVSNGLVSGSSIPGTLQRVKDAAQRREAKKAKFSHLCGIVENSLLDMPIGRGGSAVLSGEETAGTNRKRHYFGMTWEAPMTEEAAERVLQGLTEFLERINLDLTAVERSD